MYGNRACACRAQSARVTLDPRARAADRRRSAGARPRQRRTSAPRWSGARRASTTRGTTHGSARSPPTTMSSSSVPASPPSTRCWRCRHVGASWADDGRVAPRSLAGGTRRHAARRAPCPQTATARLRHPSDRPVDRRRRSVARWPSEATDDWQDVIDRVRPHTVRLWRSLDDVERARLIRHARPLWETHRHRMAPAIERQLNEILSDGRASTVAGAGHRRSPPTTSRRRVTVAHARTTCHASPHGG